MKMASEVSKTDGQKEKNSKDQECWFNNHNIIEYDVLKAQFVMNVCVCVQRGPERPPPFLEVGVHLYLQERSFIAPYSFEANGAKRTIRETL